MTDYVLQRYDCGEYHGEPEYYCDLIELDEGGYYVKYSLLDYCTTFDSKEEADTFIASLDLQDQLVSARHPHTDSSAMLRHYFESGCICILRERLKKRYGGNDRAAAEAYIDVCRCSRNIYSNT